MNDLFDIDDLLTIGIDPGETCGVASWSNTTDKFTEVTSFMYWETIQFINRILNHRGDKRRKDGTIAGIALLIENPGLNKPVFPMKEETVNFKTALATDDYELHNTTLRIFSRRAQNVGMNKQMAKFLIEYCTRMGFRVQEVRPHRKKVNAEVFKMRTKWQGRTNQHGRDAGLIVYPFAA